VGNGPRLLLALGVLALPLLPGLALSRAPAAAPQAAAAATDPSHGVPDQAAQKATKESPPVPQNAAAPANTTALPTGRVCRAREEEVCPQATLAGTFQPGATVDLRARVSGYIVGVHFHPGDAVKPGDLLFRIDPRSYQGELDKAEAQVQRAEAHLKRCSLE